MVKDNKLDFKLPKKPSDAPATTAKATTDPLVLEVHRNLISLRAGVTAAEQVPQVEVRGWDYAQAKKEVTATAKPEAAGTDVSGLNPVEMAQKFAAPPFLMADVPMR